MTVELYECSPPRVSVEPKRSWPVSPLKARRCPPPTVQTIDSLVPSVVVTMGELRPPCCAHQALASVGGEPEPTFTEIRSPDPVAQPLPLADAVTYVPSGVV